MTGYYLSSGILFNVAVSAYKRMDISDSDTTGGQDDALIAIIFSAATLEAFVMEFTHFAKVDWALSHNSTSGIIAHILEEAENNRSSIRFKYLLLQTLVSNKIFDRSSQVYEDFTNLFTLRDSIIHLKPEIAAKEPYYIIKRLRAKNICDEPEPNMIKSWLSVISTRAVGRWACKVVINIVESIRTNLSPEFGQSLIATILCERYRFDD